MINFEKAPDLCMLFQRGTDLCIKTPARLAKVSYTTNDEVSSFYAVIPKGNCLEQIKRDIADLERITAIKPLNAEAGVRQTIDLCRSKGTTGYQLNIIQSQPSFGLPMLNLISTERHLTMRKWSSCFLYNEPLVLRISILQSNITSK